MNTLLALLAFSPLLHTPQPTESPARKRVFTPFEQVFTIVQGGKKVDSIALYLVEPGPFDWKGRRENFTEWKEVAFKRGFESRDPLATFDRRRFEHAFDVPGAEQKIPDYLACAAIPSRTPRTEQKIPNYLACAPIPNRTPRTPNYLACAAIQISENGS